MDGRQPEPDFDQETQEHFAPVRGGGGDYVVSDAATTTGTGALTSEVNGPVTKTDGLLEGGGPESIDHGYRHAPDKPAEATDQDGFLPPLRGETIGPAELKGGQERAGETFDGTAGEIVGQVMTSTKDYNLIARWLSTRGQQEGDGDDTGKIPVIATDGFHPPLRGSLDTDSGNFLHSGKRVIAVGLAGVLALGLSAKALFDRGEEQESASSASAGQVADNESGGTESYSYPRFTEKVTDTINPYAEMATFTTKGRSPEQLALLEELKRWGYPAELTGIDNFEAAADSILFDLFYNLFALTNTKDPQVLADFMDRFFPEPETGTYNLDPINKILERVMRGPTEPFKRFEIPAWDHPSLQIYSDEILDNGRRRIVFELKMISFFNPGTDIETLTPEFGEKSKEEHGSSVPMVTSLGRLVRTTAVTFGRGADGRIVIYELPEF